MGAINVKHTGSGADIALSSDGTSLLLDGTAIGGGGSALELYAENPSSPTAPSATGTNAVAIGNGAAATATDSFAIGRLCDATNTGAIAVGYNTDATGIRSIALGNGVDAAASYSSAIGSNSGNAGSQAVTGAGAMALGGSYASGTDSFAAAIANNTSTYGATGANSAAIGKQNKATATISTSLGGQNCIASNNYAFASGNGCTASGYASTSIGHETNASEFYTFATGGRAVANLYGKTAHASGIFSAAGDAQTGTFVLRSDTTDATPEALTTNNSTAGTTNQVILPNSSAYSFHGTIVARQKASDGTASAAWKVEGLIRREANAASTVLVNSALTVLDNTPAWGLALTADTTNGGLKIEATGAAATNIRWVATINTSEVTYA